MTTIQPKNYEGLTTIDLYREAIALTKARESDSELIKMTQEDYEACLKYKCKKIDSIYHALTANETILDKIKVEKEMLDSEKKKAENNVKGIKKLLSYLVRTLPFSEKSPKLTGKNYQFTMVKNNDLTVEISSDLNTWSDEEKEKFCFQQEVITTKQTVLRTMSGKTYEDYTTKSKPKTTLIPNLDELRKTHINSGALPPGVKVTQEYNARRKRIVGLDMDTSLHTADLLPEIASSDGSSWRKGKTQVYKDAIDDFQSQIEIIDLEIETLKEDSGNTLPYLVDEDVNLKNKKHKLLQSKRYHSNADKAYSYHLEKAG